MSSFKIGDVVEYDAEVVAKHFNDKIETWVEFSANWGKAMIIDMDQNSAYFFNMYSDYDAYEQDYIKFFKKVDNA